MSESFSPHARRPWPARYAMAMLALACGLASAPCAGHASGQPRATVDQPNAAAAWIIQQWADRDLPEWTPAHAKVRSPRIALAKLVRGEEADVEQVNAYLQAAEPWAEVGSTWPGHKGDYNFTIVTLTAMLYRFADDDATLWPETRAHLLDVLLTEDGGDPKLTVPGSVGLVNETENHVLMTESSRYLKNQWLRQHADTQEPRYDNAANGLEAWLIDYLQQIQRVGFYEFDSVPYQGYTVHALLNLEAYASSGRVRATARELLEQITWHYALGSQSFRRNVPFRRQMRRVGLRGLQQDALGAMMRIWCDDDALAADARRASAYGTHHMLIAAVLPYRPSAKTLTWTKAKASDYYLRLGRPPHPAPPIVGGAPHASPAIFSGGPGYLITAGGAGRGATARIVARETVLLLDDDARTVDECFHLPGDGSPLAWNNTGVHHRLACGSMPVQVPEGADVVDASASWTLYDAGPATADLRVAVHNQSDFGLLVLIDPARGETLEALERANLSREALRDQFNWPDGRRVAYDVDAPPGTWVIRAIDGEPVARNYDRWARMTCETVPVR